MTYYQPDQDWAESQERLERNRDMIEKHRKEVGGSPAPSHHQGLPFFIRESDGISVLEWRSGGCRPATDPEIAMWACIRDQQAALALVPGLITHQYTGGRDAMSDLQEASDTASAVLAKWRIEP
mgnify:CR=1 FL=1